MPVLYAGFGCRRGCPVDVLEALLQAVLQHHGLSITALRGFASIAGKADEPGLQQLAARHALPLVVFAAEQLQRFEPQLSHRSAVAFAHSGCWGVAESTALALASLSHPSVTLKVARRVRGPATLALACAG
ncbi:MULTISPECIES: cobalamin biosynthesis protein [Pseudomonas]|uniref:Cobalamin biosynthesis protein n=1 Tax=Pseudomonas vlassakiae TaxID=485888 RepID=A0A923GKP7_9PSED|nr:MULTISPECIES: cobalamin biosynthesis protein [Pseudomonas]MBH3414091.1 cobalamin biosynthesis protein [Pseudomonas putida]MBV4541988.1 cobalamin biosynthesis protein [Pseudomonas vlassakiae]